MNYQQDYIQHCPTHAVCLQVVITPSLNYSLIYVYPAPSSLVGPINATELSIGQISKLGLRRLLLGIGIG